MTIYNVDGWNNFCRVFEIPERYPAGFCGGGGKLVTFRMVDWFNPVQDVVQPAVPKSVWREQVGDIEITVVSHDELQKSLFRFLAQKEYCILGREYLILCDFGAALTYMKGNEYEN